MDVKDRKQQASYTTPTTREAPAAKSKKVTSPPPATTLKSGAATPLSSAEAATPAAVVTPTLSICIPTYKRGRYVEAQVQCLLAHLADRPNASVEIVVIDNKSPDDTAKRLARFSHPRLRIVTRNEHYDTAEENMIRSVPYLNGTYVWLLGDDDIIHLPNIDYVLGLLESGKHDCLIFNSTTISPQGTVQLLQPMPMNGDVIEGSIGKIIETIGLIYTFAGPSNIIQKRANLNMDKGLKWLRQSKIYSHVAWFVEGNRDSLVGFFNTPLVFYRQNDYAGGHWEKVAERNNVPNFYFWSLGVARLLTQLVEQGCLTYAQAGGIFELAGDGSRYRLIDDVTFKTFQQLLLAAETDDDRQHFYADDMQEIAQFILKCDPLLFDMVTLLVEAHDSMSNSARRSMLDVRSVVAPKLNESFLALYDQRQRVGQFATRFVGKLHGYEVYAMPDQYVAIHGGDVPLREKTLRTVDPLDDGINILTAKSLSDMTQKAKDAEERRLMLAQLPASQTSAGASVGSVHVTVPMDDMRRMVEESAATNRELMRHLTALYNSSSWQVTSPIRGVLNMLRRRK